MGQAQASSEGLCRTPQDEQTLGFNLTDAASVHLWMTNAGAMQSAQVANVLSPELTPVEPSMSDLI